MTGSPAASLIEVLPEPAFLVEPSGRVVAHNSAAAEMNLCTSPGEETLFGCVSEPEEDVRGMLRLWSRSGRLTPRTLTWRTTDGAELKLRCDGGALAGSGTAERRLILLRCRTAEQASARFLGLNTQIAELSKEVHRRKAAEAELHRLADDLRRLNDTLERRVTERTALAEGQAHQLRALAVALTQAEDRERRRLAKVLHDHFQQVLVAAKLRLSHLKGTGAPSQLPAIRSVSELLDEAIRVSRSLVVDLSPPILADAGLLAALQWLKRHVAAQFEFELEIASPPELPDPGDELASMLFSAIRELVFNSIKFSGRQRASVVVHAQGGQINVTVSDDGHGFDLAARAAVVQSSGFGLFGLGERLRSVGGSVEVDTAPGRGTRVTLRVPVGAGRAGPPDPTGHASYPGPAVAAAADS